MRTQYAHNPHAILRTRSTLYALPPPVTLLYTFTFCTRGALLRIKDVRHSTVYG